MSRFTARAVPADFVYAALHPLRALRYLFCRDRISYGEIGRYIPDDPVIVEAGAFDGTNTREFCQVWPRCSVFAFEPVPGAREKLLRVAEQFPRQIRPQAFALGKQTGSGEMYVSGDQSSGGEQSSSLMPPAATCTEFPFVSFRESKIAVDVVRLDEWASRNGIGRIDLLWFDLQGMELSALEGAGDLLDEVKAIHCEVQNIALYEGAPLYPKLAEWLRRRGFKVSREAIFRRGGNVLFTK
jgi:FkbM family methyltransferase